MSKIGNGLDGANDIEDLAALRALQLTCYNGVSNIILESDSMWVVDALKSSGSNLSRQGPLLGEIKDLLDRFNNFEVQHVGRKGNEVAHNLARHAQHVDDMVVWWQSTLDLVCNTSLLML
ncbi:hypothetical protein AAC387_Pa12g0627 [Persea americana]